MSNNEKKNNHKWVDVYRVCEMLSMDKSTIYNLTRRKKIPHAKIGKYLRFREDRIIEWAEKQNVC